MMGIEAFVAVAELGGFRQAAARLGVTPAAISKAVAKLEADLGVRLLERTSRRVALTTEGRTYLRHARGALDLLQAGRDRVSAEHERVDGTVRLSLSPVFARLIVAGLHRLTARHPALRLELSVTDRVVRLAEEEVDVALRIGPVSGAELVARPLRRPRWVRVASPSYLGEHGNPASVAELTGHRCLKYVMPSGQEVGWTIGDTPTALRVDHGDMLVEGALAGVGISEVFDFMVEAHVAAGRLVVVLPPASPGPAVHAVVLAHRRKTPRIRALLDLLEELLPPRDGAP